MCNLPTPRKESQTLFLLFLGSLERSYMAYAAPAKHPPAPTNLHDVQSGTLGVPPICVDLLFKEMSGACKELP